MASRKSKRLNKRVSSAKKVNSSKDGESPSKSQKKKTTLKDMLGPQWRQDELECFFKAYRKDGVNWKKVAAAVRTRSADMVEALYSMNKAYLSLPKGFASSAGLIAMMTDYYSSLRESDGEQETNEGSKTCLQPQKHYRKTNRVEPLKHFQQTNGGEPQKTSRGTNREDTLPALDLLRFSQMDHFGSQSAMGESDSEQDIDEGSKTSLQPQEHLRQTNRVEAQKPPRQTNEVDASFWKPVLDLLKSSQMLHFGSQSAMVEEQETKEGSKTSRQSQKRPRQTNRVEPQKPPRRNNGIEPQKPPRRTNGVEPQKPPRQTNKVEPQKPPQRTNGVDALPTLDLLQSSQMHHFGQSATMAPPKNLPKGRRQGRRPRVIPPENQEETSGSASIPFSPPQIISHPTSPILSSPISPPPPHATSSPHTMRPSTSSFVFPPPSIVPSTSPPTYSIPPQLHPFPPSHEESSLPTSSIRPLHTSILTNQPKRKAYVLNGELEPSNYCSRICTKIFKQYIDPLGASWAEVPTNTYNKYWEEFGKYFWWDEIDHDSILKAWDQKANGRYRDLMCKVRKMDPTGNPPTYIGKDIFMKLHEIWKQEKRMKMSTQNKANRASSNGARHTGGSMSANERKRRLSEMLGREPTGYEMFCHIHSHVLPDGTMAFDAEKARMIHERYIELRTEHEASEANGTLDSQLDEELFLQAAGGAKKGRIYGLGAASATYFPGSCPSTAGSSAAAYTKLFDQVSSLSDQNRQLVEMMRQMQQTISRLEQRQGSNIQ